MVQWYVYVLISIIFSVIFALARKKALLKHPKVGAVAPQVFWDKEYNFYLPPSLFPSPWLFS